MPISALVPSEPLSGPEPDFDLPRDAALHRAILANVNLAVLITDPQGVVTTFNTAAERLFGFAACEVVGKLMPTVFSDPEDAVGCVRLVSRELGAAVAPGWNILTARARHGATDRREWRCMGRNGRRFQAPLVVTELRGEAGDPLGLMIAASDNTAHLQVEAALRDSEQRFQAFMGNLPACAWIKNAEGRYLYINQTYARSFGCSLEDLWGCDDYDLLAPEVAAQVRQNDAAVLASGQAIQLVETVPTPDGATQSWLVCKFPMRDGDGNLCVGGVGFDITARIAAQSALETSESRFRVAMEAMQEGFAVQDAQGAIQMHNRRAEELLGLTADQLAGRTSLDPCWRAIHEDGSPFPGEQHPAMCALRDGVALHNVTMGIEKPGGERVWLSVNAAPLYHENNWKPYSAVVTFADVTAQRRAQEQIETYVLNLNEMYAEQETQNTALEAQKAELEQQKAALERQKAELEAQKAALETLATSDGLTGLKNHRVFQEQLASEFHRASRYHVPLSVVLLDVDRFKSYNDTFGHPAGDRILKQFAAILRETARVSDFVARYGGEEFVVLLPETDAQGAGEAAERLRVAIEQAEWPGRNVTASFGVATLELGTSDGSALLAEADRALYQAKNSGRNRVCHAHLTAGVSEPSPESGELATAFVMAGPSEAEMRQAYDATIEGWSQMLDMRDTETEGHTRRVTEMTLRLARSMGLSEPECVYVRWGAMLHDIGKMGVPDRILLKPAALTEEEWDVMRRHPTLAYEMLAPIGFLRSALDIPLCHHEKWDGSGYPRGLAGTDIPLAARLFAIVDVWDALRSDRPYRQGWPESRVRAYFAEQSGTHFDPEVVAAFLRLLETLDGDVPNAVALDAVMV